MKWRVISAALILSALAFPVLAQDAARSYDSKELIAGSKSIDGERVVFKGEAITAVMRRSEGDWVNLKDGFNAVGVWCAKGILKDGMSLGDYKNRGDTLEVAGEFHMACPVHGGELDIHADSVKVVEPGYKVDEKISHRRLNSAAIFFILTLLAIFIFKKNI